MSENLNASILKGERVKNIFRDMLQYCSILESGLWLTSVRFEFQNFGVAPNARRRFGQAAGGTDSTGIQGRMHVLQDLEWTCSTALPDARSVFSPFDHKKYSSEITCHCSSQELRSAKRALFPGVVVVAVVVIVVDPPGHLAGSDQRALRTGASTYSHSSAKDTL